LQEERYVAWGQRILADLRAHRIGPGDVPPYLVQYLRLHLERTDGGVAALDSLVSFEWLRAWSSFDKGSFTGSFTNRGGGVGPAHFRYRRWRGSPAARRGAAGARRPSHRRSHADTRARTYRRPRGPRRGDAGRPDRRSRDRAGGRDAR
jgi:hypothetical protein